MKKLIMRNTSRPVKMLILLCLTGILTGLQSCDTDSDPDFKGKTGVMSLSLKTDSAHYKNGMQTKSAANEFAAFLNVYDYTVKIIQQGDTLHSYPKYIDMPDEITLPVGTYTLLAYKGDNKPAAFLNPYFAGSVDFSINENMRTPLTDTCRLANTRVTVNYTDDFLEAFTAYSVHFNTEYLGEDTLTFIKGETRAAYFRSDKNGTNLNIQLELVKQGETNVYKYEPDPISIEPRQNVSLLFKTDGGALNGIGLEVTLNKEFDDSVTLNMVIPEYAYEEVTKPTFGTDNFIKTLENITYNDLQQKDEKFYLDYIAPASVGSLKLTVQQKDDTNTITNEYDLATADGANAAKALGITITDEANQATYNTAKEAKRGRIHFTNALALLAPSKKTMEYSYWAEMTDALPVNPNRVTAQSLIVKPSPVGISKLETTHMASQTLLSTQTLSNNIVANYITDAGIQTATLKVERNGTLLTTYNITSDALPQGITYDDGVLTFAKDFFHYLALEPATTEVYTFTLDATDKMNEAFTGSGATFTLTLQPVYEIEVPTEHIWGWKAKTILNLSGLNEQNKSKLKFYLSGDNGSSYTEVSGFTTGTQQAVLELNNLTAGKAYKVKAVYNGTQNIETSFTTESNIAVTFGDMNNWYLNRTQCTYGFILIGTTLNIPVPVLNTSSTEGVWKSNNSTTAGKDYTNTGWSSTAASVIPPGCFPTVVYEQRDATNLLATVIRSIDASVHNSKARGTLTYENTNASRPSSLTFEYAYKSESSENFEAYVKVYAGAELIGSGSRPANAQGSDNYVTCTIPVTYTNTETKATSIEIFFASTDNASSFSTANSGSVNAPVASSTGTRNYTNATFTDFAGVKYGSCLKIDNVTLNYTGQ